MSSERQDRPPPHNAGAEEAILGSVLLDRDAITRIEGIVAPDDFYVPAHRAIYGAMQGLRLRGSPVDYLTLIDELQERGQLGAAGGTTAVAELLGAVPTPIHAEHYARIVADAAYLRRAIRAGVQIAQAAYLTGATAETTQERVQQIVGALQATGRSDGVRSQVEVLLDIEERQKMLLDPERRAQLIATTVPTTFRDLDRLLGGGLQKGELVLLAGRPSMGKSALAGELLRVACDRYRQLKAVFFTLEMTDRMMVERQLAAASGVPLAAIRDAGYSESQVRVFGRALGQLAELDISWDQTPGRTIEAIRSGAQRLALDGALAIVVVDHIQLVDGPGENRVAQVTAISKGLKALAKELNVVVLALCQLSRATEQRPDKVPILSDLRESGSLEQDADVVLMLYREEYYKPTDDNKGIGTLFVRKNRNGPTDDIPLLFNPETARFRGAETLGGTP